MSTDTRFKPNPKRRLEETGAATALVVRRGDSLSVAIGVAILYLAVFLWAIGDLAF